MTGSQAFVEKQKSSTIWCKLQKPLGYLDLSHFNDQKHSGCRATAYVL